MSTTKVKDFISPEINGLRSKWDEAIGDAEEKIRKLRWTIRVYKERKIAGEPWPGSTAKQEGKSATQN